MVPVVRSADQMSFAEIEKEIIKLGEKAREGQLTIDDLQGGTFTITNGGSTDQCYQRQYLTHHNLGFWVCTI